MLKTASKNKASCQIQLIPHENIKPNPHQPRVRFDYNELEGLACSIRSNGLLQPINVRVLSDGSFELISGERRLRAARMIGMNNIPCVVMNVSDEQSALFAIIENVQRQNLDFFEEAVALEKLMIDHGLSQEQIAKKLGKSPSSLSNKLRLLRLPEEMRDKITYAGLTERHARALLSLPDNITRARVLDIVIERHLTVAETEQLVKDVHRRKKEPKKAHVKVYKDMRIFLNTLNHAVDTIRKAGIEADTAKSETDEYFEYVIRISKPEEANIITVTTQA
ncbi:MAG: ParB/RepB/Spo0J family partition protein [Clostridia bacterium]|nr:ParB/RepB/Spo0J family partition protein [Clostridia bacterium]MBO5433913.1 ParB/RepB/Spo0J family partition protein [Clostridia bacterium]MBP3560745.1 ParB/RepB/Spo0J family partition protein [Clostridia bacterium]MBQ6838105.1 ParB/RepB/Spo0J family partition protein [Clostridia bacterium]